jgi:protein arginine kinase
MTFDLSLVPDGGLHWLIGTGPNAGIVLSSRIRLARNLAGFAFPTRAREGERLRVLQQLREVAPRIDALRSAALVRVDDLSLQDRRVLFERHLVSRELAGLDRAGEIPSATAVFVTGEVGLMVNEEDHLRLQVFRSGFDVVGALREAESLDRELGAAVPFASHRDFGFLTACPTARSTSERRSRVASVAMSEGMSTSGSAPRSGTSPMSSLSASRAVERSSREARSVRRSAS